ncbi:hypothetical protein FLL45_00280 [Aliikangiella marina]|uniref:Uncharacterized protein n=1 Tax=Aliikangiella marina TaxID=1712262 RepID=A0A545TGW8_9GAMM|nr:hypothetical protein [Aliikangiella marina]TQV76438.1 hypothetical protein FLL45_00280 [Aliikangiella marina]
MMNNLSFPKVSPFTEIIALPNPVFIPAFLDAFTFSGQKYTGTVVLVTGPLKQVKQLSVTTQSSWIQVTELKCKVKYLKAFIIHVIKGNNYGPTRSAELVLSVGSQQVSSVPVVQAAGELVSETMTNLVKAPMVMEAEILTKFIASEVKKLPPPIKAIAIPIINGLYVVAALLLISIRSAFFLVPNPTDWKRFVDPSKPENQLLLISPLPTFTDYIITQQSIRLMEYFDQQVLS